MWTEVKRRLKSAWAALGVALLALGAAAIYLLGRQRERSIDADAHIKEAKERIAAANAEAAIQIHVARAKDESVRVELKDITRDKDGPRRRQRLLELDKKIRGRP